MDERRWYEAEALMADSSSHRHAMRGSSEEKIERRIRKHYPDAVVILARRDENKASAWISITNER